MTQRHTRPPTHPLTHGLLALTAAGALSACGDYNFETWVRPKLNPDLIASRAKAPPTATVPAERAPAESPPLPSVKAALETWRAADPDIRVTWLRGHVDAFTARPRATVPDYAARALARHGMEAKAVAPSFEPVKEPGVEPKAVAEPPHALRDIMEEDGETTWYRQDGAEVAKDVLAEFLAEHDDVFRVGAELIEAGLPNLELTEHGVGRHFRRVAFQQRVGDVPLVEGKTVVLFDLSWNVIAISRQLATREKLPAAPDSAVSEGLAEELALQAVVAKQDKLFDEVRVLETRFGIDAARGVPVYTVALRDDRAHERYTVTLDPADGEVLNVSDDTARFSDAQVKRWAYSGGDMTAAYQVTTTGLYTHDDDTLVHDFFYVMNDDRNDGGTGTCTQTAVDGLTTPAAYGTTTGANFIRPTIRSDRNFALWAPSTTLGSFGEGHVYYWAREYMLWQKQALVDLGVLTLGSFNNYTKALLIVNACAGGAGNFDGNFKVTTRNNDGENLGTILLPEVCRSGNSNCGATDYADSKSGNLYTYEGGGGYHFPGVITHELNHFVLIDYFGVANSLNCSSNIEQKYFQEGGIGRTLPQIFWASRFGIEYLPGDTNLLFRSDGVSGRPHDPADANSLNHLSDFACADGTGDPYGWGGVVAQPMWEIYHGKKVVGSTLVNMGKPAADLGMIKAMYYAADMTAASTTRNRAQLANRFMEFWELFSTAVSTTKADWCDVWEHHGVGGSIDSDFCS
ncbi:MAG: hypothetical protein KC933_37330 [Myxococcales bacterium]|nr:hypothetical protein [Myxococcales bacterium]